MAEYSMANRNIAYTLGRGRSYIFDMSSTSGNMDAKYFQESDQLIWVKKHVQESDPNIWGYYNCDPLYNCEAEVTRPLPRVYAMFLFAIE